MAQNKKGIKEPTDLKSNTGQVSILNSETYTVTRVTGGYKQGSGLPCRRYWGRSRPD